MRVFKRVLLLLDSIDIFVSLSCLISQSLIEDLIALLNTQTSTMRLLVECMLRVFNIEKHVQMFGYYPLIFLIAVSYIIFWMGIVALLRFFRGSVNPNRIGFLGSWESLEIGHKLTSIGAKVLFLLFCSCFGCRYIEVQITKSSVQFVNYDIVDTYNGNEVISTEYLVIRKRVSQVSDALECRSESQYIFSFLIGVGFVIYTLIWLQFRRLQIFRVNKRRFLFQNTNIWIAVYLIMTGIALTNHFGRRAFKVLSSSVQEIFYIETLAILGVYLLISVSPIDYNRIVAKRLRIEIFLLLMLYIWICYFLYFKDERVRFAAASIIIYLLFSTLALKIHLITEQLISDRRTRKMINYDDRESREALIFIYFEAIQYINSQKELVAEQQLMIKLEKYKVFWMKVFSREINGDPMKLSEKIVVDKQIMKLVLSNVGRLLKDYVSKNPEDKTIKYLELSFLIEIKYGFCKAVEILSKMPHSNSILGKISNLFVTLLHFKLTEIGIINQSHSFIKSIASPPDYKCRETIERNQSYIRILNFLSEFDTTKTHMNSYIGAQLSLLFEIKSKGRMGNIHTQIDAAFSSKILTISYFKRLSAYNAVRYTPLIYLQYIFEAEVKHAYKAALKLCERLHHLDWNENIYLLNNSKIVDQMIIIAVDGEKKNFHKIVSVFGNVHILGYKKSALLGMDLSTIIPNAFSQFHENFLKLIDPIGGLLQHTGNYQTFIKLKNGDVTTIQLTIRLDYSFNTGLRFIGFVDVNYDPDKIELVGILDEHGNVEDCSSGLRLFLKEGRSTEVINPQITKDIEIMRRGLIIFNNHTFDQIAINSDYRDYLRVFFEWREGKIIDFVGENFKVVVKINEYLFRGINIKWVISVQDLQNEVRMVGEWKLWKRDFLFGENLTKTKTLIKSISPSILKNGQINCRSSFFYEPEEKMLEASLLVSNELIQDSVNLDVEDDCLLPTRNNLTRTILKSQRNSTDKDKYVCSSEVESEELFNLTKRENGLKNAKETELTDIILPSQQLLKTKINRQRREILNSKSNGLKVVIFCHFCIFVVVVYLLQRYRQSNVTESNLEIKEQLQTSDKFSWAIQSMPVNVFFLEMCRVVKSNIFSDDFLLLQGLASMIESCQNNLTTYGAFQLNIDLMISDSMSKLRFPHLVNFEWNNLEIELLDYSYSEDKTMRWRNITYSRNSAVTSVDGFNQHFIARNYQDDLSIPILTGQDEEARREDPIEELYRFNLQNNLYQEYVHRSYDFYEYLKNVALYGKTTILIETMGCILIIVGFSILIGVVFMIEVCKIAEFFYNAFSLKTEEVDREIDRIISIQRQISSMKDYVNSVKIKERRIKQIGDKLNAIRPQKILSSRLSKNGENKKMNTVKKGLMSLVTQIKREGYTFELCRFFIQISIALGVLGLYKATIYIYNDEGASRLINLTKTTILGMESYASLFNLHNAAFEIILWNNTATIWNKDALFMYNEFKEMINIKLVDNLTEALTYDLGNYTSKFREDVLEHNACGYIFHSLEPELCSSSYGGVTNANLITSIKGMVVILDGFVENWKVLRTDFEEVKQMMASREFKSIWAKADSMIFDLYYFIVLEISKTLTYEVNSNIALQEMYTGMVDLAFFAWAAFILGMLFLSMKVRDETFKKTIEVVPEGLWLNNFKISKHRH